jgi:hypothetical protein
MIVLWCMYLVGEVAVLFLAFLAIIYAIKNDREKTKFCITPAVLWIIGNAIYVLCVLASSFFSSDVIITGTDDSGFLVLTLAVFIFEILPAIMILIVWLISRHKSRN